MNPLDHFLNDSILMKQQFAESEWLVPGIIPIGLTLFAGKPKIGKSWYMLQVASDLSEAGTDVLYMGLEDPYKRLQDRLVTVRGHDKGTGHLTLCSQGIFPRLDQQGIQYLREWLLARCPDTKLIVIDTFAMIKPRSRTNANAYEEDYLAMTSLKKIADEFKIGIVVVHHVRKFQDPDDPFANVSGTNALGGCADTIAVLDRDRKSNHATLHLTGRDVETPSFDLTWQPEACRWVNSSPGVHETSETGRAILDVLQQAARPLSWKEIFVSLEGQFAETTIRMRLSRMTGSGVLLHQKKVYFLPSYISSETVKQGNKVEE